mgnify:CR=1 FL=1
MLLVMLVKTVIKDGENYFIKEKIKDRPVDKKKLAKRIGMTALIAVVFGVVSAVTFTIVYAHIRPDDTEPIKQVSLAGEEPGQEVTVSADETISDDETESDNEAAPAIEEPEASPSPDDTVSDNGTGEAEAKKPATIINNITNKVDISPESYTKLYRALHDVAQDAGRALVTVTATTTDTDWFENPYESGSSAIGLIIADNGRQLLILVDSGVTKDAEDITVSFADGTVSPAKVMNTDADTSLQIIGVTLSDLSDETKNKIAYASLGSSTYASTVGTPVIAQNQKCALWSGELRPDVLKTWIQMVAAGKDFLRQSSNGQYWFVPNDIATKIDDWTDGKFFLYNNEYSNKWEQIFADMKELLAQGVRIFILDNLFSLDIDVFDGDSNKKQKELINQLTDFKKKNKAHIILVAHPRKTTSFIRKTDISGTSAIIDAADYIFIIHRVNNDFRKAGGDFFGQQYIQTFFNFSNVLEVAKDRMMGTQDYLVGMYYEVESRRFKNTNDEKLIYGWREQPKQTDMFADTNSDDPFGPPLAENEVPF